MRHRRKASTACPFAIGSSIRPIAMFDHHDYRCGENYEVTAVDPNDSTLQARDEHGQTGRWIRWCDCESTSDIGWDWLKGQLSAESLELLSAFDGLQTLKLRPDIRIALIQQVPALKERVLAACEAMETTATTNP